MQLNETLSYFLSIREETTTQNHSRDINVPRPQSHRRSHQANRW